MEHEQKKPRIQDLVDQHLADFRLARMTTVVHLDTDGREAHPVGLFENEEIAKAYREIEMEGSNFSNHYETLVLTNGKVAFVIHDQEAIPLFSTEETRKKLKEKAVEKMTPTMRRIMGFLETPHPQAQK